LNEEQPRASPEQGAQEKILFRDSHAHILLVGMHRERENSHVMRIPDCWSGCAVAVKKSSDDDRGRYHPATLFSARSIIFDVGCIFKLRHQSFAVGL
jgi:hypothetical protein